MYNNISFFGTHTMIYNTIKHLLLLLITCIVLLYPVPETGSNRNILFLAILLLLLIWKFLPQVKHSYFMPPLAEQRYPLLLLFTITAWMFIQTTLFAVDRAESFNNLIEEWMIGGLIFGWLTWNLAKITNDNTEHSPDGSGLANIGSLLITGITLAAFAQALWLFYHQIPIWQNGGAYPYGSTPYAQRDFLSFPINLAFIVFIADIAGYISLKKRILRIPLSLSTLFIIISTAAIIAVHTRNGVLSAVAALIILAAATGHYLWYNRQKKMAVMMVAAPLLMINIFAISTINTDSRWAGFWDTVEVATDIENNRAWLDSSKHPYPKTKNGDPVDASAYLRIAWITLTIEGIEKHPLGYGYGLGAAGKYIEEEYERKGFVSSHSGILDFTLANGVPGLILWILFSAMLLWSGWSVFMKGNPYGLLLILMLANFFTRTVLDGHFGGFRFKMFALFMGAIFYLATHYHYSSKKYANTD